MGQSNYPQKALKCKSSMTEPFGQTICPEFANNFCVKEIMGMNAIAKANCGRTKYFGDTYNQKSGKCELRKCAAACEESAWSYEFEGITYQRQRFCCNYEFCNAGGQTRPNTALLGVLVPVAMALAYALASML
ncbi:hypothetical protein JKP88DRAFT_348891 [Tribonema minus]|uniref:Uncharacterized protein n=1 Tax=Tribonema minus TaxID=303371 RepID=A0A835YZS6_9STRA|nr:hypothetical protein JKP88DRAFT_348891 [Tribonema minus]